MPYNPRNEQTVTSAFYIPPDYWLSLPRMLHCTLTFRKQKYSFINLEGLRLSCPYGRIVILLFVSGMSIWKLNDRPIWYSFGKAGHDHRGMYEPPRSWNTAQKAGSGTWLDRTAKWDYRNILFASFLQKKALFGNIARTCTPTHLFYHNSRSFRTRKVRQHCHRFPITPLSANSSKAVASQNALGETPMCTVVRIALG